MDDRPSLFDDRPALSDNLTEDVVAYRPISPLAVIGAVLGLASPLALVSGFLAPIPLGGALISLIAIQSVRRDPDTKSGLGVAVFGLLLSMLVLGAVAVRGPLTQRLYQSEANRVVDRFFTLLEEGDVLMAHELTRPFPERRPNKQLARLFYDADPDAKRRLIEFEEQREITRVLKADTRPELVEQTQTARMRPGVVGAARTYRLPAQGDQPELGLKLRLERRTANRLGVAAWRITGVEFVSLAG